MAFTRLLGWGPAPVIYVKLAARRVGIRNRPDRQWRRAGLMSMRQSGLTDTPSRWSKPATARGIITEWCWLSNGFIAGAVGRDLMKIGELIAIRGVGVIIPSRDE